MYANLFLSRIIKNCQVRLGVNSTISFVSIFTKVCIGDHTTKKKKKDQQSDY